MRQYSLQLPQELEKGKRYPLLLWNDALPETLAALLSDMFVLSVVSSERTADFSPWPQPAFRADAKPFEGKADAYHRELFWEKLPELLTKYPIDAERIAYGGYSLGGLAAVYSIFRETAACAVFRSAVLFGIRALRTTARGRKSGMRIAAFICKTADARAKGIRHRSLRPRMPQSGSRTSYAKRA